MKPTLQPPPVGSPGTQQARWAQAMLRRQRWCLAALIGVLLGMGAWPRPATVLESAWRCNAGLTALRSSNAKAVRCDDEGPQLQGLPRLLFGGRIAPLALDATQLEALPGVGPRLAQRIAAHMHAHPRGFDDPEGGWDRLRVIRGIGPRTVAALKAQTQPLRAPSP